MRIFHITNPSSAVAIVESGTFYPASNHQLNNDNGLNCFRYKPGYQMGQCFAGEGARLIFEWNGPVTVTHKNTSPPLPKDVLHDQHPWRCFIRGGTKSKYLRVVGIQFAKGEIDSIVDLPSWHRFLPAAIQINLARRARLNLLRALRDRFRNSQLFLEVVG